MNIVHPAQTEQWLADSAADSGLEAIVLDVREPWEFQTASIQPAQGYTVVQMPMRSVPARYLELNKDQPIACMCHHGARSAQVAHFLMQQGFSRIANIHGGIHAWSQEKDASVPMY